MSIKIPANVKDKKKYLAKKADDLWREVCIKEYGDNCIVCGGKANQVHHWIKRSQSLATHWDIENGIPVCQTCHYVLEHSPDVKKRRSHEDKIIEYMGQDRWDRLEKKKRTIFKKNIGNLEQVIADLKEMLK